MSRVSAIVRCRCPHCLKGPVFSSFWAMHERCPFCGAKYEREEGYFMNSIFIGYVLGFLILVPALIALYLMQASTLQFTLGVVAVLAVFTPFIFRYARVIWMHMDELMDPRPDNGEARRQP